jgi:hypothetical protein
MGLTIEFYSADAPELAALFSAAQAEEIDFDTYCDKLESYPMADFSLHLELPGDLDSLCQSLQNQNAHIPSVFREVLFEQIWDDGVVSESLTVLSPQFAEQLSQLSENAIEGAALEWLATYPSQKLPKESPVYQAVWQLHEVARDAIDHRRSLVLRLCG